MEEKEEREKEEEEGEEMRSDELSHFISIATTSGRAALTMLLSGLI